MIAARGPTRQSTAMRRFVPAAAGILIVIALLVFACLRHLGEWLVVDDPLQKSTAIVVMGGGVPFRAMEAARIFHEGWAPKLWLTRGVLEAPERAMIELGFPSTSRVRNEPASARKPRRSSPVD